MRHPKPGVVSAFLFVLFLASLAGVFVVVGDLAKTFSFLWLALTEIYSFLEVSWQRPLLSLAAVLLFVAGVTTFWFRNEPLSVVAAVVTLSYQDDDETELRVEGTEWFRVNQPNVSAHFTTLQPNDGYYA